MILELSRSFFLWLGMGHAALLLLAAAVFNIYRWFGVQVGALQTRGDSGCPV